MTMSQPVHSRHILRRMTMPNWSTWIASASLRTRVVDPHPGQIVKRSSVYGLSAKEYRGDRAPMCLGVGRARTLARFIRVVFRFAIFVHLVGRTFGFRRAAQ